MLATPRNMRLLCEEHGEAVAVPGVFAYSPETGERCSASPGDYWFMDEDECLEDSEGNPMILASAHEVIVMEEL